MAQLFDLKLIGDKDLQKKLNKMSKTAQKKAVRPALRDSAKRTKARVLTNLGGGVVNVITGDTLAAFKSMGIRSFSRSSMLRVGMPLPTRDVLGISADDPFYYPIAIEYGHGSVRAKPFLRPAIDEHANAERAIIGRRIAAEMIRLGKKGIR